MRCYSMDLRERVIAALDAGIKRKEVARRFNVSSRTITSWLALRRQTGTLKPRSGKPGPKQKIEDRRQEIVEALEADANLTLQEIKARFDLLCCLQTIWNALRRWGITLKKSDPSHRTTAA